MMFNPEESIDFNGNTGPFIHDNNTAELILNVINMEKI